MQVNVAPPKAGEALVRIVASGVCHTDAFTLSGDDPEGLFPVVLGHKGWGEFSDYRCGRSRARNKYSAFPLVTGEYGAAVPLVG